MMDEEVIDRALNGERAAFEALVEAYWPVAERTAYGLLGDAALSEDVAQDVFADIYMTRARYEKRFSFHAYVAALSRYKSIDLLRRRRPHQTLEDFDAPDQRTPEGIFIENMFLNSLYAAVECLPERQRRMLKAYALEEKPYRDIAAELGVTVAQVKITLSRVRKKLRKICEDV